MLRNPDEVTKIKISTCKNLEQSLEIKTNTWKSRPNHKNQDQAVEMITGAHKSRPNRKAKSKL